MWEWSYSSFILTSAVGGEWSASRLGWFTHGKELQVHIAWKASETVWTLRSRKNLCPTGNRTPPVEHIALRCTDWRISILQSRLIADCSMKLLSAVVYIMFRRTVMWLHFFEGSGFWILQGRRLNHLKHADLLMISIIWTKSACHVTKDSDHLSSVS
jgi:hypothetical protein